MDIQDAVQYLPEFYAKLRETKRTITQCSRGTPPPPPKMLLRPKYETPETIYSVLSPPSKKKIRELEAALQLGKVSKEVTTLKQQKP